MFTVLSLDNRNLCGDHCRVPSLVAGTAEQMNEFCPCIYLDIASLKYCSNGLRLGCKGDVHLEKWAGALLNPILKLKWN